MKALMKQKMKLLCYLPQWYAIALSIAGDTQGGKVKLENAKIAKKHFEVRQNTASKAVLSNSIFLNLHHNPMMQVHVICEVYFASTLLLTML